VQLCPRAEQCFRPQDVTATGERPVGEPDGPASEHLRDLVGGVGLVEAAARPGPVVGGDHVPTEVGDGRSGQYRQSAPVPNAGLVHFLVYRSRATLRVGHLPVKRAMPADSRSRSGVEDGRAD
jgi:hypothetical protein